MNSVCNNVYDIYVYRIIAYRMNVSVKVIVTFITFITRNITFPGT